eukprot:210377_1
MATSFVSVDPRDRPCLRKHSDQGNRGCRSIRQYDMHAASHKCASFTFDNRPSDRPAAGASEVMQSRHKYGLQVAVQRLGRRSREVCNSCLHNIICAFFEK